MRSKYKIAVVDDEYPRVSQTFVYRQVKFLNATVITPKYNTGLQGFYNLKKSQIIELKNGKTFYDKIIEALKWKLFKTPSYQWKTATKNEFLICIKEYKVNIVLAQFGPSGINTMAACQKANIPLVVHFHGIDATVLLKYPQYIRELKELFITAKKMVVVNKEMKERFIKLGCKEEKLVLIPVGASVDDFTPNYKKSSNKVFFLYVGRFVEKKSPLNIVAAFKKCLNKVPNASLIMIGDGTLLKKTKDDVKEKNIESAVSFLGSQPKEIVAEKMKSAHIFVQHSVTAKNGDQEGWPVSIAEAAASGLPIVATKHTGIKEQVLHGETGFLVEENDVDAMAAFMVELALSPNMRIKMGKKGREHTEENGSFKTQVEKLREVLYNAIEK